ncbi:transglutaminase family protein [Algoriphagus aestuarii]|nr:transglutaminase family protein [Algoriphagus aestuarii]
MKLQINHFTEYTYQNQVFLGIHQLFLRPQNRLYFSVLKQELTVSPVPEGKYVRMDISGNFYEQVWFLGLSEKLKIQSDLIVETKEFNPYSFLIDDQFLQSVETLSFPKFKYEGLEKELAAYYLMDSKDKALLDFVLEYWNGPEDVIGFLSRITAAIHSQWEHILRHEMDLWEPEFTLSAKKGSCRDLAYMQMSLLGSIGLATRFVSGYAFNPNLAEGHELHAWLEVYLPGGGWIGLDPSLGLLTDHRYVPLASHAKPPLAAPVQGSFSGNGSSILNTDVQIKRLED